MNVNVINHSKDSNQKTIKKMMYLIMLLSLSLWITACGEEDIDGNETKGDLVIQDSMYKNPTEKEKDRNKEFDSALAKIKQEKALGIFDITGKRTEESGLKPGLVPQSIEDMNKFSHLPHKYVGDIGATVLQYPKPDTLGEMISYLVPLSHAPMKAEDVKRYTSPWGFRTHPIYKTVKPHGGVDLAADTGKPIFAVWPGEIKKYGVGSGYGNVAYLQHGVDFETRYGHMSKFANNPATNALWKVGDKVKAGDIIGYVGSTGDSTGPHLHFEIRFKGQSRDPYYWFNQNPDAKYKVMQPANNGTAPGEWEWPEGSPSYTIQEFREMKKSGVGIGGKGTGGSGEGMFVPKGDKIGHLKSYMNYTLVRKACKCRQYLALNQGDAYTDNFGFRRRKNGDYFVAMGTFYGEGGDRFEVTFQGGDTITVTMGDVKSDAHTNSDRQYHRTDFSIIEFLVDQPKLNSTVKKMGNASYHPEMNFKGPVESIKLLQRFEDYAKEDMKPYKRSHPIQ